MKILLKVAAIILLSSVIFTNCTSIEKEGEDIKARYGNEVMDVHDEIMPLTMKIPPLKEDLEAIKAENPDMATPIDEAISNLDEAYQSMYNWMDSAGKVQSELYALEDEEAANTRLEREKTIILYIQEFTENALKEGQALKEKLSN